jgi:hypothetical protein
MDAVVNVSTKARLLLELPKENAPLIWSDATMIKEQYEMLSMLMVHLWLDSVGSIFI